MDSRSLSGYKEAIMKFIILFTLCILFSWSFSTSTGLIQIIPNDNYATKISAGTEIATCLIDYKTIIVHGDSDKFIIQSLLKLQSTTIVVYNNASMIDNAVDHQGKLNSFLLTANSSDQLQSRLLTIKYSPWWNIMAPFIILDQSDRRCLNARDILKTAWRMNIVTTFFICFDNEQNGVIYSYNPYTNRAPQPWKRVEDTIGQSDGWTMFSWQYDTENNCEGLNFDRTKYLDGAELGISTYCANTTWTPDIKYHTIPEDLMHPFDRKVAQAMQYSLNASIAITFGPANETSAYSKVPVACLRHLRNSSTDIALCGQSPVATYNFSITYPIAYFEFSAVTQRRGFYTPVEKIVNYYGPVTLVSMIVLLLMTFGVIIMSGKTRRYSFATFEVLRLVINASLHSKMSTFRLRTYFSMIFLYFLIMHATFQGNISSFLTKPMERENIKKLEDLKNPRYTTLHTGPTTKTCILDETLLEKIELVFTFKDCVEKVAQNASVACAANSAVLAIEAYEKNLHLMDKSFGNTFTTYATRDDWPLKNRIDIFFMRLEQSGLNTRWVNQQTKDIIETYKRREASTEVTHIRPIDLPMLEFAFNILGFGLSCSIICFVFERFFSKKRSAMKEVEELTENPIFSTASTSTITTNDFDNKRMQRKMLIHHMNIIWEMSSDDDEN